MNLVMGIICLWVGAALLFLASHGLQATSPWGAFQTVLTSVRGEA